MSASPDLPQDIAALARLQPHVIHLGLANISAVRDALGLKPSFPLITVAGTNGKGSTCAMLESVLHAGGYKVGCYTSPHLLSIAERIRVGARDADPEALTRAFAAVEAARGDIPLTYFEFGTLAALWLFMDQKVDVAVLEVGLGGRQDAVNAFDPDCAVLVSVAMDHMEYLGDTREAIGLEKAGIFRPGRPAISAEADLPDTVRDHARAIGAPLARIGRDFGFVARQPWWTFQGRRWNLDLPWPGLPGVYQLQNASAALAALESLADRLPLMEHQLREGIATARLPGRFQVVPGRPEIVLDVAHNPHAAAALAEGLAQRRVRGRTHAVFAMLADKDVAGVAACLAPQVDRWLTAGIPEPRGASAAQLAECLARVAPGREVLSFQEVPAAFRRALADAAPDDRVLVFGSFRTVAAALPLLPGAGGSGQTQDPP